MARDSFPAASSSVFSALRTFRRPWPIMGAGLAVTVGGLVALYCSLVPLGVMCLLGGTLLAGIAVAKRLKTTGWELEERAESAGMLAAAAFAALLGLLGMGDKWDSGQMFYIALISVSLVGSGLVLLPQTGRRIAAFVLVVLHFGGILTAVSAVPPRNEPAPWLSMMSWAYIYRDYLQFCYLTNAYHFYSPDPGPPTLVWFHVEYDDGKARWIKIPNRSESPMLLHHQRMLAAAESTHMDNMGLPLSRMGKVDMIKLFEERFHRKYELLPGIPHPTAEDVQMRRNLGATLPFTDPNDGDRPVPLRQVGDDISLQYSEPQDVQRRLIASYARHIARTSPDPENPTNEVRAVRVYRVVHELISPRDLQVEKKDPLDPNTFKPFYMGKYDPDGRLLDPKDPFLFWYIPILRVPRNYGENQLPIFVHQPIEGPDKLVDWVEIHATQSDKLAHKETDEK